MRAKGMSTSSTSRTHSNGRLFLIPAGLALVAMLIGAGVAGLGFYQRNKAQEMLAWPSVQGVVTSSGFTTERRPGETRDRWLKEVTSYTYEVDGTKHVSTLTTHHAQWAPGDGTPKEAYPAGPVKVYYNPEDPADGSLTNQYDHAFGLLVGVGALAFILSVPFWLLSASWFRKRREGP
jgi:hypothetical protein